MGRAALPILPNETIDTLVVPEGDRLHGLRGAGIEPWRLSCHGPVQKRCVGSCCQRRRLIRFWRRKVPILLEQAKNRANCNVSADFA